jgi:hypothetical protein
LSVALPWPRLQWHTATQCRRGKEVDPETVNEWAQLLREDGESDDWQQEPQMRYDSGDEWDDRLRHEQFGEDGYEEWTWDRCILLTFRHAVSEIFSHKRLPLRQAARYNRGRLRLRYNRYAFTEDPVSTVRCALK